MVRTTIAKLAQIRTSCTFSRNDKLTLPLRAQPNLHTRLPQLRMQLLLYLPLPLLVSDVRLPNQAKRHRRRLEIRDLDGDVRRPQLRREPLDALAGDDARRAALDHRDGRCAAPGEVRADVDRRVRCADDDDVLVAEGGRFDVVGGVDDGAEEGLAVLEGGEVGRAEGACSDDDVGGVKVDFLAIPVDGDAPCFVVGVVHRPPVNTRGYPVDDTLVRSVGFEPIRHHIARRICRPINREWLVQH